jgi:pyruvate dehydrogenase E1 component beta subunit
MTYKDALKQSMEELAKEENTIFLGYNISHGSKAYGTLVDIPLDKKIETPVAENLMIGLAIGMALEGYKPVVFYERHDFILNALDGIVNHLGKLEELSRGEFSPSVIIRATIGDKLPINPGPQHSQDFTKAFREMIHFPIYEPMTAKEVIESYNKIKLSHFPSLIIERRELYNQE